jgi:O-antigen/teichoic acid export membrane protein
MGIIAKQTIKGSIYTYAGVFLGFIGTGILMPKFFTTEEVGLTTILLSAGMLFSQFGTLGFSSVNTRLFPYFRDRNTGYNGLLTLGLTVSFAGFILSALLFLLFQEPVMFGKSGKSDLMADYSLYVITLIFFTIYFLFFDSYAKALYDSIIGTFLRDFLVRLLNLMIIILYVLDYIDFDSFIKTYVLIYILPTFVIIFVLIKRKQIRITHLRFELLKNWRKEIIRVSFFGILAGFSGVAFVNIDTILTNFYLGLSLSGVYGIIYFTGSLILKPAISLRKISSIVVAEAWKRDDKELISKLYYKSTIDQLIIGLFLFGGILINTDTLFWIIPEYAVGEQALIILIIGFLIEMLTGISGIVMSVSNYYKFSSVLSILSVVTLTIFCFLFTPAWGINGTAIAVTLNYFLFFLIRYFFLYRKYKFQPYQKSHIIVVLLATPAISVNFFIPSVQFEPMNFLIRSGLFSILFLVPLYFSKVSENYNIYAERIIGFFSRKKRI